MENTVLKYLCLLCTAVGIFANRYGSAQQEPAASKVLFVGKSPDHPHGTHMYLHTCRMLARCIENNGEMEAVVSNGWPVDAKSLANVKTVVLYSTPGAEFLLDGPGAKQFQGLMKKGVGLVTLHWASSVFEKNLPRLGDQWGGYLGGFWVSNYGLSTDRSRLRQLVPEHPVCRGWKDYELRDEYYLKPVIKRGTPLLQVNTRGEDVVVGWTYERPDGGRSYGTTLGHFYSNFQIEAFRRTVVNAILWTAHQPVPAQGANVELDEAVLKLPPQPLAVTENLLDRNLVAWCIVPFDSRERGPAQRAEMLRKIGLQRVAYDWRQKHVPDFEEEIIQYRKQGIEYFAFWDVHEKAFELFRKHKLRPQIWKMMPQPVGQSEDEKVKSVATQLLPLVEKTRKLGGKLGLYNHGGWTGEPKNMVAVCRYLRKNHQAAHVGIVYNQHHGHSHVDGFPDLLKEMKPYLLCLNLNGMTANGDKKGRKILPVGEGDLDLKLLRDIILSGYQGPIGIIGHTQDDVELRLRDNLDGLHWLLSQLDGRPAPARPKLRTYAR